MKQCLIFTSAAEHLAEKLRPLIPDAAFLFFAPYKTGERRFPDQEVYIRIDHPEKLINKKVVVIHSGAPFPNEGLVELEMALDILKMHRIKPWVFFTYFPYAMQDRIHEKGETNAARNIIKKLADYYNVRKVYAIDPHFEGRDWLRGLPFKSISALPLLRENLSWEPLEQAIFMSPDKGGKRRTGIAGMAKKRLGPRTVSMSYEKKDLKGKTVIVVDDMIKMGNTLMKFLEIARKLEAEKILALVTHGVIPEGVKTVKRAYDKLYLTNTVASEDANVDISPLIASVLGK